MTERLCRSPHTAFIMGFESPDSTDDASYLANLLTSEIAVLKGPSTVIWEILEHPTSTEEIITEVTDVYGLPREAVAESVLAFLYSLLSQGLLHRLSGPEES